jgi:hypothetical protein
MKKSRLIPLFSTLFIIVITTMCSKSDDPVITNENQTAVISTVSSGNWRVTKLITNGGTDASMSFTGYNFVFSSNSVLTASDGTNSFTGTWSVTDSNSNDDTLNDLHFNITFNTPVDFSDLTGDWHILTRTSTKVELNDTSGGNGGTDYLTFEKN